MIAIFATLDELPPPLVRTFAAGLSLGVEPVRWLAARRVGYYASDREAGGTMPSPLAVIVMRSTLRKIADERTLIRRLADAQEPSGASLAIPSRRSPASVQGPRPPRHLGLERGREDPRRDHSCLREAADGRHRHGGEHDDQGDGRADEDQRADADEGRCSPERGCASRRRSRNVRPHDLPARGPRTGAARSAADSRADARDGAREASSRSRRRNRDAQTAGELARLNASIVALVAPKRTPTSARRRATSARRRATSARRSTSGARLSSGRSASSSGRSASSSPRSL